MGYKAVIFDLFGTLVYSFPPEEYERTLAEMAACLSLPYRAFSQAWQKTYSKRARGAFPTIEANLEHICRTLGKPVEEERIKAAVEARLPLTRRALTPRPETIEVLSQLRGKHLKIGLISNCSPDVPPLWGEVPFASSIDVVVFSCVVGLMKPDSRIYQRVCERLDVKPQDCLYIGDGADGELEGAAEVGMNPVRIRAPYEGAITREWQGTTISTLREVLGLIG